MFFYIPDQLMHSNQIKRDVSDFISKAMSPNNKVKEQKKEKKSNSYLLMLTYLFWHAFYIQSRGVDSFIF